MVDYINKVYLKETQFSIKFTGNVSDLILQLQEHKRPDGKFRFEIKKRRAPDEYGNTHFMVVDDWMPKPKTDEFPLENQPSRQKIDSSQSVQAPIAGLDADEIPF